MNKLFIIFAALLSSPLISLAHNGEEVVEIVPIFTYTLIAHVLLGIVGVIFTYAVWMGLMKRKLNLSFLKWSSFLALLSFLVSWATVGVYYVGYYGANVKPVIKAGEYAWAHSLITETKEHVFLILPFLVAMILATLLLSGDSIEKNTDLRRSLIYIAGVASILGILITIAGVVISGAT